MWRFRMVRPAGALHDVQLAIAQSRSAIRRVTFSGARLGPAILGGRAGALLPQLLQHGAGACPDLALLRAAGDPCDEELGVLRVARRFVHDRQQPLVLERVDGRHERAPRLRVGFQRAQHHDDRTLLDARVLVVRRGFDQLPDGRRLRAERIGEAAGHPDRIGAPRERLEVLEGVPGLFGRRPLLVARLRAGRVLIVLCNRRFGAAEKLDGAQPPRVVVRQREVLLAEQPAEGVGQEDVLELDAHGARPANLAPDVGPALPRDLLEDLADGYPVNAYGHAIVVVLDDARLVAGARAVVRRPRCGERERQRDQECPARHGRRLRRRPAGRQPALRRNPLLQRTFACARRRLLRPWRTRRGARAAEGARLESVCTHKVPRVRIPPSPLVSRASPCASSPGRLLFRSPPWGAGPRWLGPAQESVANPVRSGRKQRYRLSLCAAGYPSRHRRTPRGGLPPMTYQVLARRLRPQRFAEVVGQEHVTRTLQAAIAVGRIAHAFLFAGPRGVGKTTTARLLAKALNCERGVSQEPCNECANCREIAEGRAFDVLEIDGASHTQVDKMRDLMETVAHQPIRSRFKIFIIDEVHMLSQHSFNALLKTLEEPPPHVKFIFATTDPHKVLATVLSRCQRYDLRRIGLGELLAHLKKVAQAEGIAVSDDALALVAREADGSLRDAQSLLDQVLAAGGAVTDVQTVREILGAADRRLVLAVAEHVLASDGGACVRDLASLHAHGYDPQRFCRDLLDHFRNLTVLRVTGDAQLLAELPEAEAEALRVQAERRSADDLQRFFRLLLEADETLAAPARTVDPQLVLEMAVLRLATLPPLLPVDDILRRLEALGAGSPASEIGRASCRDRV